MPNAEIKIMIMKHLQLTTILLLVVLTAHAQNTTFNHDESYMQQFLVTETGAGSLTPSFYYNLFHRTYQATALMTSKQSYRTSTFRSFYKESPYADSIDSSMIKRAKIEALNIADRMPSVSDLAWALEGGKIEEKFTELCTRISQIVPSGGSLADKEYFEQRYNCLVTALASIRDAYMPLSERKRQYLEIYNDSKSLLQDAVGFVTYLQAQKRLAERKLTSPPKRAQLSTVASGARGRWKISLAQGSGASSGPSGGNGVSED